MSIIYCFNCQQYIDTDYDVEHEEECDTIEELMFYTITSL